MSLVEVLHTGRIRFFPTVYESMCRLDYTRDLWEYLPDRDVWEPRAGITLWKPDYFTFSAGTDQGGYIGCAKDGLWMYSPEKDK